jgi:hypothetical protein
MVTGGSPPRQAQLGRQGREETVAVSRALATPASWYIETEAISECLNYDLGGALQEDRDNLT